MNSAGCVRTMTKQQPYLSSCSRPVWGINTPFRAFLMDVVQSDFAFIPNKLDLIRDIALGTDNAERKAYSNNKYGLVEYSIRSGYVKISYKNRNGVRKEGALDWRELYEILSYMVKQPFYCGEDQKKYYQETKQKTMRQIAIRDSLISRIV